MLQATVAGGLLLLRLRHDERDQASDIGIIDTKQADRITKAHGGMLVARQGDLGHGHAQGIGVLIVAQGEVEKSAEMMEDRLDIVAQTGGDRGPLLGDERNNQSKPPKEAVILCPKGLGSQTLHWKRKTMLRGRIVVAQAGGSLQYRRLTTRGRQSEVI